MEKDRVQRYAESLERTIQNNHHYLKETIEDFQGLCLLVTPERNVPPEIIVDIREMYKEIRDPAHRDQGDPATPPGKIPTILSPGSSPRQRDHGIWVHR